MAPTAKKSTQKSAARPSVAKKIKPAAVAPAPLKASLEAKMAAPVKAAKQTGTYFYANGKRKTSVASVRLYTSGKGTITVNGRSFENYFPVATDQDKILSPLRLTRSEKTFDIFVHVRSGGIHSQAEAARHGISKALLEFDVGLRPTLKPMGFLTRDSRVKERKKYGLKRARRAPQFSKR